MTKFYLASDLHLEFGDLRIENKDDVDCLINGNVERSKIKSTGDIFVKGGIIGYYLDGIDAGNNLICKFAENSVINTSGHIVTGKQIGRAHV